MTDLNKQKNVRVELEKGRQSLRAAAALLELGLGDDAMSRMYYAAFHHVQALLLTEGIQVRTHNGVHDLFHLNFIKPGHLPPVSSRIFSSLQRFREQADYSRTVQFSDEDAADELERAKALCLHVTEYLERHGW